eukprot:tig00000789_g4117.t1
MADEAEQKYKFENCQLCHRREALLCRSSRTAYDFDGDEKWKAYRMNLEIPPGRDEAAAVEKMRRKWFAKHVDSNLPPAAPSGSTASASSSSGAKDSSARASQSTGGSGASSGGASSSGGGSGAASSARPSTSTGAAASIGSPGVFFGLNALVLFFSVNYVVPLRGGYAQSSYQRALFAAMASYVLTLVQKFGLPNVRDFMKLFDPLAMRRVMSDSNAQYIFMCSVFLSSRPSFVLLIPVAVSALYQCCFFLNENLRAGRPALWALVSRPVTFLLTRQISALQYIATLEVTIGVLKILELFTPARSFLAFLMYWQFLMLRYATSGHTRGALVSFGAKLDAFSARLPGPLQLVYRKARGLLVALFNPAPRPARAQ